MPKGSSDREEFRRQADRSVLVLYATVVETLGWATVALLDQDTGLAERLIRDDQKVDEQCAEVTALIKERLAEATVAPDELEDLIALLQMVPELERSADLSEHIAQRARHGIGGSISPRARGLIQSMCDVGIRMWQLSSRAYAERSRDLSFQINEADDELDRLSADLLREGAAGGADPAVATELALIARFYERLGDHAVNLARRSAAMAAPRRLSPMRALDRLRRDPPAERTAGERASLRGRLGRFRLVPSDNRFFGLFREATATVRECGDELVEMFSSFSDLDDHFQQIRSLERRGDEITVAVLRLLADTFVTPYDREDIHALAEEIDDVLDEMQSAAALVHLIPFQSKLPDVAQQAETLARMAVEMEALVECLQSKKGARHRLERIEELEREGDAIHRRIVGHLFSGEYDALEVLKWKDVVQSLENAMNRIEDVADVVESILVKSG